jgi:hypothetical protein
LVLFVILFPARLTLLNFTVPVPLGDSIKSLELTRLSIVVPLILTLSAYKVLENNRVELTVAFTTPFYFKPANASVLAKACIEIGEAVPELAFYYYHIPVLTGVHITMYELLQAILGKLANFVNTIA